MMLTPGTFLQERYEILEKIGSGGMSDVYRAKCHKLNRTVAIKVLKEEFSQDASFVSKFKMEAQSAAGLSHPNIVSVYDVVDEGVLHYIVMEVIEGITLKSYILKKGRLGIKETVSIAIQVALGIGAAHDQHIVHRDIKPQNMIISKDGKVKVADFGIARAVSSQTSSSTAVGSVHYISPEQARGGYSDARSDIYSLGITMYEMVTGKVPFDGENTVTIALAHLEQAIIPPSTINPEVPQGLERIIQKCTQKKPERRYNNAAELITDLRELRRTLAGSDDIILEHGGEEDTSSPTVVIGGSDLDKIQESAMKTDSQEAENDAVREGEDVNPKIEKILTTVGIAAACIIIAVVVSIFAKVGGGILNSGSGKKEEISSEHMEETQASSVAESIDQTVDAEESETGDIDLAAIEPKLETMKGEDAKLLLEAAGFVVAVPFTPESSETVPKDMVIRYDPVRILPGGTVTLIISSGPAVPTVKVPDITNLTPEQAKATLEAALLVLGAESEEKSETVPKGTIIRQSVLQSSDAPAGTVVNYTVSIGKGTRFVAVVNDDFPLKDLFGPSTGNDQIRVQIVMKQIVNGQEVTTSVMDPRVLGGDITLPVHYKIPGAPDVLTGELQILDLTNNRVLKTYPLEFLEVNE